MPILDGMTREEKDDFLKQHADTHLTRFVGLTSMEALEDVLLIMAKNVELAMLQAGAEPRKDYTFRDLFELAMPLVLDFWKHNRDSITFSIQDF